MPYQRRENVAVALHTRRCLQTTGWDYQKFLSAQLTGKVLGMDLVRESERDYTPFIRNMSFSPYGLYSFGHWLECFDSWKGYTPACTPHPPPQPAASARPGVQWAGCS